VNKELINQPLPPFFVESFKLPNIENKGAVFPPFNHYYLPFKEIFENSFSMGIVEFAPDIDGVYRSTHLLRPYHGEFYPVLSMSYILKTLGYKSIKLTENSFILDDMEVPLLMEGRYLINMKRDITNYSIGGVFSTIQKLNKGETEKLIVNPEDFKDKIVIIGASAVGVEDLKLTSTGQNVPGVYLHASTIANFLDKDFIQKFSPLITYIIVAIINILLAYLILTGQQILWPVVVFVAGIIFYTLLGFTFFDYHRIWIEMFAPMNSMAFTFLILFIVKSVTEGKEKKFLKAAF
jgi:adenylate cyclase